MKQRLLFLLISSFIAIASLAQFRLVDSCVQFTVNLKINHPYSDTISYMYFDCEKNQGYRERIVLQNGILRLSGTVNRAGEIIFICKPAALFEDSSYYRLIVEGEKVEVELTMADSNIVNDRVTGSEAQTQKRNWEKQNHILLETDERYLKNYSNLLRSKDVNNTIEREQLIRSFQSKLDLLLELRLKLAAEYIRANKDSYFSVRLLDKFKRRFPVDTILYYFQLLTPRVQQSSFGKSVLNEALAQSKNWQAFSVFFDSTTYHRVKNIRSIYDISLPSIAGNIVSLSQYKGKIILLDFWASWCGPCIKSIPATNRLKDEVKHLPIVILPVSVDINEKNWRNAIEKNKFQGTQLLDKESLLAAYYKVLGYPTYVIIDQDGKLIDGNAPSPNDGESLKKRLVELVSKIK